MDNIGFGCVRLTYNYTEKQAIKNLETAYDHGIKHFDAARLYGFGLAEGILGKFIENKRAEVTITTKLGIFPNNALLKNLLLQNVFRNLFRLSKKLPLRKSTLSMAGHTAVKNLDIKDVEASLQTSLKELRTDYIDYLLLHEATVAEANAPELIGFLETQKQKGLIKNYGLGSYTDKLLPDFLLLDKKYTVLQTDNAFPNAVPASFIEAGHITKRFYFSPFQNMAKVSAILKADAAFCKSLSDKMGFNVLTHLLDIFLMQQHFEDAQGTFLFTSAKNSHIINTAKRWTHVTSLPPESYNNFAEVRSLINQKMALI